MTSSLFIVFWLPGSGKSTVSRMIRDMIGPDVCTLLRTDEIRRELFPSPIFSQEENAKTYAEFYRRADKVLKSGKSVVMDAVFCKQSERDAGVEIAVKNGCKYRLVCVTSPEDRIEDRITKRKNDASDADFSVYKRLKAVFEKVVGDCIFVDNSGDLKDLNKEIDTIFQ